MSETWSRHEAFRPGSGRFGWLVTPVAQIEKEDWMPGETSTFDSWAIVEVMGHRQFAGHVTEESIGGSSFVRVDVPGNTESGLQPFTKLLGAGSIYAITPCTEETARAFAAKSRQKAFDEYEAPRLPAPDPDDVIDPEFEVVEDCGDMEML